MSVLPSLGFNGAALFQVRKSWPRWVLHGSSAALQWGRTFSSAEVLGREQFCLLQVLLQWGRTFSSAEVQAYSALRAPGKVLQWGRTFSSAEVLEDKCSTCSPAGLQWGRTFSSAEVYGSGFKLTLT